MAAPAPSFKCVQLEIITQPKVFVLFVWKIISEIIIALAAAAKQAAALLLLPLRVSSGINYEATLYAIYNLLFIQ